MLFKNENPILGPSTQVTERSGYGAGNPVTKTLKPITREILTFQVPAAAGAAGYWIFQAPWKCQVLGAHFNCTVAGLSTATVEKIAADAVAPAAANGTTIVNVLSSTIPLNPTANTRANFTPSTVSAAASVLNPGDQLAVFVAGAATGLVGGNLQVEIAQIG